MNASQSENALLAAKYVAKLNQKGTKDMPLVPDAAAFQRSLAAFPVSTYQPGEVVLAAGSKTGRLLVLRHGVVEVSKDGAHIARISEPGAVFGELAVLLDKPHTADVRAVERSEFNVADAAALLTGNLAATLHIAAVLARRLDGANSVLVDVRRQLETGKSRVEIAKTVSKAEDLLNFGVNLVYAGYPSDPFAM